MHATAAEDVCLDELRIDTKDPHAVDASELRIANSISRPRRRAVAHAAIDLDGEPVSRNVKVSDARMQGMLPPHPHAQLLPANPPPQGSLAPSRLLPHPPSDWNERKERRAIVFEHTREARLLSETHA
jgi:hypothetical protein